FRAKETPGRVVGVERCIIGDAEVRCAAGQTTWEMEQELFGGSPSRLAHVRFSYHRLRSKLNSDRLHEEIAAVKHEVARRPIHEERDGRLARKARLPGIHVELELIPKGNRERSESPVRSR